MISQVQEAPAVRLVDAPTTIGSGKLGFIAGVRELPDGRLLINDAMKHQLLVYDIGANKFEVVLDSARRSQETAWFYGNGAGVLLPFAADSNVLVDPETRSMIVITPSGRVARIAAAPPGQAVGNTTIRTGALDWRGRLEYQGTFARDRKNIVKTGRPDAPVDSFPLLAFDFARNHSDTVAVLKTRRSRILSIQRGESLEWVSAIDPISYSDDWAVLSDGTVAIVRGQSYHVELLNRRGEWASSRRIPFPWRKVTDAEKNHVIDSLEALLSRPGSERQEPGSAGGKRDPTSIIGLPTANDLADYWPAVAANGARADQDGHLWVRTTLSHGVALGPVYDIIDSSGALLDRIQLPAGHGIVGFGRGGVVYLATLDGETTRIERTRLK